MATGFDAHYTVRFRLWRFFIAQLMVPNVFSDGSNATYWRHNHWVLAWGNPDGKWKVLKHLPF